MFQTLDTFDTEFSADSVEWCPVEDFSDIFACGTYQLAPEDGDGITGNTEGEKKKRIGRIYLFRVVKNEKPQLKLLQQLEVPAVLDMKWAHVKCFGNKILLGVVNSQGFLQIYELLDESEVVSLKLLSEISLGEAQGSILALSLDWSTGRRCEPDNDEIKITVSDSGGSISLFKLANGGEGIARIGNWHAHEFEAWITAFDYWNTNVVYTGGDDCKFLRFDTRMDTDSPTNTNRSHNAGVTSLHCNWKKEFCLVSGSYDESLRTWDTRSLRRPLAELSLGGGIWRLKWDPREARRLLAACMYKGFCLVDCGNEETPEIVAEYKEHRSIAYGCDWSLEDELLATCSFYDHALKLSAVKFEED